jgi:hypothetical protein
MHLYIYYYSYPYHEGNCSRMEPFAEVMDPEGSQYIHRNNTLEVKTPGLIVVIVIPLIYFLKFATLQVDVVVVTTFLKLF